MKEGKEGNKSCECGEVEREVGRHISGSTFSFVYAMPLLRHQAQLGLSPSLCAHKTTVAFAVSASEKSLASEGEQKDTTLSAPNCPSRFPFQLCFYSQDFLRFKCFYKFLTYWTLLNILVLF